MRIVYRPLLKPALVALSLVLGGTGAAASSTQRDAAQRTIVVESGRPLADAVETLQSRLGIVITYEDPPYLDPSQLRDATDEVRRGQPNKRRIVVPRGGPLSFSYQMPEGTRDEQVTSILGSLLERYRANGYPGDFQVERTGTVFHVVPTGRLSREGRNEAFQSILSTTLEIEPTGTEPQSAIEALRNLVDSLGRTTDVPVVLGTIPTNLLRQSTVASNPGTRSAREELVRILASTGQGVSWQLFFGNEPEVWALNIYLVR